MAMRVVIIGAGNVATHLAKAFDAKAKVAQIYSHTLANAELLCQSLKQASATDNIAQLIADADLYIVSVKDDAIAEVVNGVRFNSGLWVHTSGSVSIEVLKQRFTHCGVLYPLQTFSRNVAVEVEKVPFFIEGRDDATAKKIGEIAKMVSNRVLNANSEQRKRLHAAAVFACNFVNHLWSIADDVLSTSGYDFDILLPLINATLEKAAAVSPAEGQTGPARRGDRKTMHAHEKILTEQQANVYKMLSNSIMKKYNNDYEQN